MAMASVSLTGAKASLSLPSSSFMGASIRISSSSATSSKLQSNKTSHVLRVCAQDAETEERFRLNNLRPQPGSRRLEKRKGRGIAAGQGASCGFGMRGQNSRSGSGVRPGFEGGQMPLYRRLPKLKGIAGGMGAGLPKYVSVNLEDIVASGVEEGEEVSLESLKLRGLLNPTGRDRKLPLKILGSGDVTTRFSIKATSFSSSAKEKLEAAGCTIEMVPKRTKFIGGTAKKRQDRATEYFAKKNAVAA